MSWLRRIAIAVHGLAALWLLVNGIGHTFFVISGARAGTLRPDASLPALLAIGAGLLLCAGLFGASVRPLWRGEPKRALGAVGCLAVVLGLTALRYGFTFLIGAIVVGALDFVVLGGLWLSELRARTRALR